MSDNWQKIDEDISKQILKEINKHIKPVPFNEEETVLRETALPFYKGYSLIELTDMSVVPGAKKYAIYKEGDVNIIDWTNQVIYDTNKKVPLSLSEINITDYVNFFFSYIRGRHGRFLVIETADDVRWQEDPPVQGRKVLQEMLKPITVIKKEADDSFVLEVFMMFKDSLFKSTVNVQQNGDVEIIGEELMIESLPIIQDSAI